MAFSDPVSSRTRLPRPEGPLARFAALSLCFAALAGAVGGWLTGTGFGASVAAVGFAALAVVAGQGLWRHYPHDRLGGCNVVTLFRAALIAGVAAVLTQPAQGWALAVVAAVALALDGVDGKLARASGLVSDFGARFDMEVDSIFALVMALIVWLSGTVGVWVLVLGVMRYLWVAAGWILPWLNGPLPEQVMRRKTVCVIQIAALAALLTPVLTGHLAAAVAAVASAALLWSFGSDVIWLWRRREA
jgi:phosphatidylglycerophosphate synthase